MSSLISFNLNAFKTELLMYVESFKAMDNKLNKRFVMVDGNMDYVEFADGDDNDYWIGVAYGRLKVVFMVENKKITLNYEISSDKLYFSEDSNGSIDVSKNGHHDVIKGATKAVRLGKEYLTDYLPYLE